MKSKFFISNIAAAIAIFLCVGCSNNDPGNGGDDNGGGTPGSGTENGGGTENGSGTENGGGTENPDTDPTWTLIFEDDFEGTSKEPNSEYWTLCEKGDKTWNRYMSGSYDQAYVEDGSLYLIGEQVDGEYLTGGIETRGKFDFTYGKVECRARFVKRPQGNHTGIWMMPEPPAEQWPKSGEIDIMEHLNDQDMVWETVHTYYADDLDHKDPKPQSTYDIDNTDWNVYGVVWTADSITFTVNGEDSYSYPNLHLAADEMQWPFDNPFSSILSQSLGGEGTWEGPIDNSELPSIFEIDWVKVWQKTENQ